VLIGRVSHKSRRSRGWLIAAFLVLGIAGGIAPVVRAERSTDGEEELLPIYETDAERALRPFLDLQPQVNDSPPVGPVHSIGEYDPCTGALVRYPLGVPYALIREITRDVTLHVILRDIYYDDAVANFIAEGVDTARVDWVLAPNNSIWTRDYGPWFVFDGNGQMVIMDHYYNRPARPDDNAVPRELAAHWGMPVVTHGLWHAGGNYLPEGSGISYSTDLVWNENATMSHAEIAQFMLDYYGVTDYEVLPDISETGIHHMDTWGKLLDEETILLKQVDPSHPDYARIEANAVTLAGITNRYGRPFKVIRVFCPQIPSGDVAAYTNCLILNDKVLVPLFNLPGDSTVLQLYRDNMPGYEVLGFAQPDWISDDALHCRVMQIHDRYMLRMDHDPVQEAVAGQPVTVTVFADDRSESGLDMSGTMLHWRVEGAPSFLDVPLAPALATDWYEASVPSQPDGTRVEYYVTAADSSGRSVSRPRTAPAAVYSYEYKTVTGVGSRATPRPLVLTAAPSPFSNGSRLSFDLPSPGSARLAVYDVRGRMVTRLTDRVLGAGVHAFNWMGRDAHGNRVPSGVYFAVLDFEGRRATRRLVLIR
jgi:agmatine deiminase